MKEMWLSVACAVGLVVARTALAQSPDIISFHGNGQLTWTNSDTNLFYGVEWAPSLAAPSVWEADYLSLIDIRSSGSIVTSSVPMFYRVRGSSNRLFYAAPIPKTGQTTSFQPGDDGDHTKGVTWPHPRFAVQTNTDCILDNLTGLVWARNANLGGSKSWSAAITYCEGLTYGGTNDWRLPNVRELFSLVDFNNSFPSLPSGHPFASVQAYDYWTSTTTPTDVSHAFVVGIHYGGVNAVYRKTDTTVFVWPVRGGP